MEYKNHKGEFHKGGISLYNMDCMELMKQTPDDYYSLCIVDPPYFTGPEKPGYYAGTKQITSVGNYKLVKNWQIPKSKYFNELIRVSKNQIIWGINYFDILLPGGRVVWIKGIGTCDCIDQGEQESPFSQADIAYQSFYNRIDLYKCLWSGFLKDVKTNKEVRIHPTQKPIALYNWLLKQYAEPGQRILDTHGGSFSSAIAAHYFGCDFVGCEIDNYYYEAAKKRFDKETRQTTMF